MEPLDLRFASQVLIDWRTKGFPAVSAAVALSDVGVQGWSLFEDLQPPVLVLRERALRHNLALMAEFCASHRVDIAPHGKTSMAPQLYARQLEAGAWGITAATVGQARVMRAVGVRRILLANELVDRTSIAWVCEQLSDPSFDFLCYVDSGRGVSILSDHLRRLRPDGPLRVLVELGHPGGRTGCRDIPEALRVASMVRGSESLELAGVAGYEGTICQGRSPDRLAAVGSFLHEMRALTLALIDEGAFDGAGEIVVSAGGSSYFDLVVDQLQGSWPPGANVRVVLRSGCYLTHDSGFYERGSPFAAEGEGRRFRPAIEVWASVLSRPEPGLAILGFGKRDVSHDLDLPIPHTVRGPSGETSHVSGKLSVRSVNDQHAFCHVEPGLRVEVGDLVGCGISHPCTALDKWRIIPVLDDDGTVIEAVATFF